MCLLRCRASPVTIVVVAVAILGVAARAQAQTAFYIPTHRELAGAPGTLIRAEPMRGGRTAIKPPLRSR